MTPNFRIRVKFSLSALDGLNFQNYNMRMAKKIKSESDESTGSKDTKDSGSLKKILAELGALRADLGLTQPLPEDGASVELAATMLLAPLASAFATPPKIEIVRTLLLESPQSAAQIGQTTGLSTGSLYHHLRELTHSGVLAAEGKAFAITPLGKATAAALSQLAGRGNYVRN
jgi:hypothetical protein